ncbi:hypothetical protein AB3R30_04820 [Leptolyngbyaceae cyanobacterium UHCC 1019]
MPAPYSEDLRQKAIAAVSVEDAKAWFVFKKTSINCLVHVAVAHHVSH